MFMFENTSLILDFTRQFIDLKKYLLDFYIKNPTKLIEYFYKNSNFNLI